jgi:hypothetical protein
MEMVEAIALVSGRVDQELLLKNEYLADDQFQRLMMGPVFLFQTSVLVEVCLCSSLPHHEIGF